MSDTNLLDYINNLASTNNYTDIERALINAGWKKDDVIIALNQYYRVPSPESKGMYGSTSMWDSFEHILMFISLYTMAFSIVSILYVFIDKWVPGIDAILYSRDIYYNVGLLRGSIASLIVSTPLFSYFFLSVTKRTKLKPSIKNLTTRKLLTYFTLVVTFVIVLGYIISLIYSFLSGNVTLNFFLKFLVTVLVSGVVFLYYLNQVKEDRKT